MMLSDTQLIQIELRAEDFGSAECGAYVVTLIAEIRSLRDEITNLRARLATKTPKTSEPPK